MVAVISGGNLGVFTSNGLAQGAPGAAGSGLADSCPEPVRGVVRSRRDRGTRIVKILKTVKI